MTDTPPDWVLKEAAKRCAWPLNKTLAQLRGYLASSASFTELCRAIEQHEAFRQEVSDAVEAYLKWSDECFIAKWDGFDRFIIPKPKPDPLVAACNALNWDFSVAEELRTILDALGFEIREKNDDA